MTDQNPTAAKASATALSAWQKAILLAIVGGGTLVGLAGLDLVLPSVPTLPEVFDTTQSATQFVLAAYVTGYALGLLGIGAAASRLNRSWLLIGCFSAFAVMSWVATLASSIEVLIAIRFLQGLSAAAPAVLGPRLIRRIFSEKAAMQAIGTLGSIESLIPALAPVAGAWLLALGDWRLSFLVCAGAALVFAAAMFFSKDLMPPGPARQRAGRYSDVLAKPGFRYYALSHALIGGALLTFVFGAPAVIVNAMGGSLNTFITMQITGISLFILAANLGPRYAAYWGYGYMIWFGNIVGSLGFTGVILFALFGNGDPWWLVMLFAPVNLGFGIRAPIGFHQAIVHAGDDERGTSLLILAFLGCAGLGTAIVAPLIDGGLVPLVLGAAGFQLAGLGANIMMRRPPD